MTLVVGHAPDGRGGAVLHLAAALARSRRAEFSRLKRFGTKRCRSAASEASPPSDAATQAGSTLALSSNPA
jgi:hypothetical protein